MKVFARYFVVKLLCDTRFQRAFTACICVFKVFTLDGTNQSNYFENITACCKYTLKTRVATQLNDFFSFFFFPMSPWFNPMGAIFWPMLPNQGCQGLRGHWAACLQSSRPGMSNWRPAGRMRPLCLFCVARIGILLMQQLNKLAYFFIFLLKICIKVSIWVLKTWLYNILKLFSNSIFG